MRKNIFKIGLVITMVFLGLGFFIRSFNTAEASIPDQKIRFENANQTGKYMLDVYDTPEGARAMIWDTQTGQSIFYKMVSGNWVKHNAQLPSKPL